ncbi:MAG: GMC family oxidoreductase [Solirubrobacterales bacterium]
MEDPFDCDVAVIGSGFGGAVSALRLAEKGYSVVVLEQGRRVESADIARARHDIRAHLWEPDLGLHGFFWQRVFRDVGIIGASGVGGGSIVWGAVLLEPGGKVFADQGWGSGEEDWQTAMAPHFAEAGRMLGRVTNPFQGPMDEHLRQTARAVGGEENFGPVPLAIHFGQEGETEPDPFFGGKGPERTGCRLCGGCLSGCPYGSKNTLDLNYLYLAEKKGVQILAERRVESLVPLQDGGYELKSAHPWRSDVACQPLRARRVVLSGGVLGSLELLFRCRDELGTLPHLSPNLGKRVRTNSEAVSIVLDDDPATDLTRGPAISTDFHPDDRTHVTQNRYVGGGKLLRPQVGPLVDGASPRRRALATLAAIISHPLRFLRTATASNFEGRLTALTVMQDVSSELSFEFGRSPFRPWRRVLRSRAVPGREAASYIPLANDAARKFAESSGGTPLNLMVESIGGRSFTAHILGGAVMGDSPEEGVIDASHEVYGHPGLFVVDASAIPVNLGVNPSLTITAMAERFASLWPDREAGEAENSGGGGDRISAGSGLVPGPQEPIGIPTSPAALKRLWRALPAPATKDLIGVHRAVFVGPAALSWLSPAGLGLLGLPDWYGKQFQPAAEGLHGINLLRQNASDTDLISYLEMKAIHEPSMLDGAPVLVSTYGQEAPLPWRFVRDEFRLLGRGRLLGMAVVDRPFLRRFGMPFLLEAVADS